eukprot:GCRY01006246.1.p1 GENE.GCRY01006246.1~~GCRY01006246.1.p1  ORF type:complete len:301 (+),score=60.40 GCRY01006246.1:206-1108(+)
MFPLEMSFDCPTELVSKKKGKDSFLGSYELKEVVGEGSYGKVKKAVHVFTGEYVAIKILEKERLLQGDEYQRVYREIDILKKLSHPNIVQLLDVVDTPKHLYVVMEYCDGGELFDYIVAQGRVNEKQTRIYFRQLISALHYLHSNNVAHRDLKPENLLLSEDCKTLKLIDFGFSNVIRPGLLFTTYLGSPAYSAPELIRGINYDGKAVDIWACGVILYALTCGFLPFDHPVQKVMYENIAKGNYDTPDFMPPGVKTLLRQLLQVDVSKRATLRTIVKNPWMNRGFAGPCINLDHPAKEYG